MAVTPRSGFSITTSGQNNVPDEIPNTQPDLLNNMAFITDSALNKNAIDTEAYPNTTDMIVGFTKGKRTLITYYRNINANGSNIRTNISDYPATRNVIDAEYQKILNLEITLPQAFTFGSNSDTASISITGQAFFYPNMNPSIGDTFLLGTGDGRIGLARISGVAPLSWRTNRAYSVSFVIQSFATVSDIASLDGSTTITSVFSKENYLGGSVALLSEQTYLQLEQIKATRGNLCRYYHQTFFDTDECTYLRPDSVFDPLVTQFMSAKITMAEVNVKPKNMLGKFPGLYNTSIWARLTDRYNNSLYGVYPNMELLGYSENRLGSYITELYGTSIVFPSTISTNPYYLFSVNFWTGDTALMTPLELLIYNLITTRLAGDLGTLITSYLDLVPTLSTSDQFYYIPLYLHLIDVSLQSQYRELDAPGMGLNP